MRRLSGEDNSFLAWESAVQPQHTIKAVVLDPAQGHETITFNAVRAALPGLVDRVEPLQWQLLSPRFGAGRPWWITRARGDLNYHMKRATAAAPGTDRELGAEIAKLFEEPLDRDRPAWQLWYIDGLADGRPRTLDEIGRTFGISRERVRQIERDSMVKLRADDRSEVLREYAS